MATFAPGTVFRTVNDADGSHLTAVLLRDGQIMQVGQGGRRNFANLDAWTTEHSIDASTLKIDVSNAHGVVVGGDTHGFNYTRVRPSYLVKNWPNWCYEMIAEGAPHLLENSDVKHAFNALVDVLATYEPYLNGYLGFYRKTERYNIKYLHRHYQPGGFPVQPGGFPAYLTFGSHKKTPELQTTVTKAITDAYTTLYTLIKDDLTPFMTRRYTELKRMEQQSRIKHTIKHLEKKKTQLEESLAWYKKELEKLYAQTL